MASVHVLVDRDLWDWGFATLGALAALSAIVLFIPWALERRRRPELSFLWEVEYTEGDAREWSAGEEPMIRAGTLFRMRVSLRNVGDAPLEKGLANFVVPDCFKLTYTRGSEQLALASRNRTAGLPPGFGVRYTVHEVDIVPGNWKSHDYLLEYCGTPISGQSLRVRLLFDIAEPRLNRGGRRWFPVRKAYGDESNSPIGQTWPPQVPRLRRLRPAIAFPRALPKGQILCARGSRQDCRDVVVSRRKARTQGRCRGRLSWLWHPQRPRSPNFS